MGWSISRPRSLSKESLRQNLSSGPKQPRFWLATTIDSIDCRMHLKFERALTLGAWLSPVRDQSAKVGGAQE